MNAQRITSAKFIWLRAPMTSAPIIPNRINAYIANAESLVKSHISISKFMPRWERDKLLDLSSLILRSHCSADDGQNGNAVGGNENRPLDPNSFTLMLDQLWKQIKDGDAQSINGMEQDTEENKNLENPILINIV